MSAQHWVGDSGDVVAALGGTLLRGIKIGRPFKSKALPAQGFKTSIRDAMAAMLDCERRADPASYTAFASGGQTHQMGPRPTISR